jgi:hypothetical protein
MLAAITLNGGIIYGRYDEAATFVPLAELYEHTVLMLPINIMFNDASGAAYRTLIDAEGPQLVN